MELSAFILHLTRAESRRANARDLVELCGVPAEIWPAVDGSALSPDDIGAACASGALFNPPYPFDLRVGEVGCFLSHRQIWGEILARGLDAAIIIEDDADIDPDIYDPAIDLALRYIDRLGYIQLQTRAPQGPVTLIDKSGPCALTVPQVSGLRTTAQIVSAEAAEWLLGASATIDRPVDTFLQCHWQTMIRVGAIHPSGVTEIGEDLAGSTIQSAPKPWHEKLTREWKRLRYRAAVTRFSRHSEAPNPVASAMTPGDAA